MKKPLTVEPMVLKYLLTFRDSQKIIYKKEQTYIQEYGLGTFMADYPEILMLKGGKSGGETIEEYLSYAFSNYLETQFGKLMQNYYKMLHPKDKERWNYSHARASNTILAALGYFETQLRALDPDFVVPNYDLNYTYDVYFHANGKFHSNYSWEQKDHRLVHASLTKTDLLDWVKEHPVQSADQIAHEFCAYFTRVHEHEDMLDVETYTYSFSDDERIAMNEVLAVLLNAQQQEAPVVHEDAVADEDDGPFEFEISTGCEAEQCSSYITVEVTKEELLEWAAKQTFDRTVSVEGKLEDWFKERDHTEEDDHCHDYDYGQDGYLQLERMVALVEAQQKGKK